MAELALISALIHLEGQKAMCDNDCRTTYNTPTRIQKQCMCVHADTYSHQVLTHTAWAACCQKHLHISRWLDINNDVHTHT